MAEEGIPAGRLSRAMAKAGEAERLMPPGGPGAASAPPPAAPRQPARPAFQRVTDRWGEPGRSLALFHDKAGQIASQVRALRTRLMSLNHGRPPRVITVTSGTREEGKTTMCANLAAALSEVEAGRVLMVDGDTLRPAAHLLLNVKIERSLYDVLRNGSSLDGAVYETALPNMDVLPCRVTTTEEGIETALTQNVVRLIAQARGAYSFVIIDTPPVLAGSQASMFARNSDGVVIVARLERTPRQVVRRAVEDVTNAGGKVIGCLLTHHEHHVPDSIYRFFGTTPIHYYRYSRTRRPGEAEMETEAAPVPSPETGDA